jgi:outer membrane autotransporter protein
VIQQQSGVIRSVLGGRLRQAVPADGATQVAALGPVALPVIGGSPLTVWSQGLGVWNNIGSAGNAAGINSSSGGYLIGVDAPVGDSWQIGLASGFD